MKTYTESLGRKTKLFTVRTTRKDIEEWQNHRHRCAGVCPIRKSFLRQGKFFKRVNRNWIGCIRTPKRVSDWIRRLDFGKPVRPITFKIKLPLLKGVTMRKPKSREYHAWCKMKARCYRPTYQDFKHWGGRGISVCKAWKNSFEIFLADMGPMPLGYSIERKDNNGNYCPSNCIWIPRGEQSLNRSNSVKIAYRGTTMLLIKWAELLGFKESTLRGRRQEGWTDERMLSTPPNANRWDGHKKNLRKPRRKLLTPAAKGA